MNRSLNKVYHFQGTESAWQQHIANGDWTDSIVFGLVRDYETDKVSNRIYAGKDSLQTDYEYKSTISVDSVFNANQYVSEYNIGLLINVINPNNSEENGSYIINYDENNQLVLFRIGAPNNFVLDASSFYNIVDSSNKIISEDPAVSEIVDRSAEGVNVKIFDPEDSSQTVKFTVDLDKIYLPHGIQRTEAIGQFGPTDEIVTDGVGMSVKELLEYYLLKEKFPTATVSIGSGSFTDFGMTVSGLPLNVSNYIKVGGETKSSDSLAEIGSSYVVSAISGTVQCSSYGMQSSVTSTASKISNLNFGYSTEKGESEPDGHYKPAGSISTSSVINGNTGTANAIYTIKDTDLTIDSTLSVKSQSSRSYTTDSTYQFDTVSTTVTEGNNKVTLELTHNASATRTLENTVIPSIPLVYIISNKTHVSDENVASAPASVITGSTVGTVNKYTKTEYNIIGVYPIFTNGKVVYDSSNLSEFGWYNDVYSTDPVNQLELVNYLAANQIYKISFGTSAEGSKCYMFVPKNMTFIASMQAETDSNFNICGWRENSTRAKNWIKENTITINVLGNQVEYDAYYDDTRTAGKWAFEIQINKK